MRPYTAAVLSALALGLAACDPRAHDSSGPAVPPADAPVETPAPAAPVSDTSAEFGAAFRLIGTEPFWAVKIGPQTLVLSRPDHSDLMVSHAGPTRGVGQAQWSGEGLSIRLVTKACSDGMSDRTYAYAAEVKLGETTLKGCADAEARFAP